MFMSTNELVCPKCGSALIEEENCFDTYGFGEVLTMCYTGTCMDCGEKVRWDEMYEFIRYEIEGD